MVYYQQHLNVNRLWLEHIVYEADYSHVLSRTLSHCQIYIDEFAVVQYNTVRYTLMNLQWFSTTHVYMTVYEI